MISLTHTTPAATVARQPLAPQADAQPITTDVIVLDPETRSRLQQLGRLAHGMRSANAQLQPMVQDLATNGLSAVGPASAEALNDAVAMEEFKRKKQKESELVVGLRQALHNSTRSQAEFLRALAFLMPQLESYIQLEDEDFVGLPGFQTPMENPADMDTGGLIWNSHADFFAQISAMLEVLKTEWLSKYQDTLAKFLEFYQEFSDIMEDIKFEASGDKGDVTADFSKVKEALDSLLSKFSHLSEAFATFSSPEGAHAFIESLGLPGLNVTHDGQGTYYVTMDTSALKDILNDMPGGTVTWDSARYNAWVSAKDSNMEQIKHVSKVLGEKLNEMTQKFDNVVKILSSSIDRMSEANKAYVNNS